MLTRNLGTVDSNGGGENRGGRGVGEETQGGTVQEDANQGANQGNMNQRGAINEV